jgi:hypothetical protein
LMFPCGQPLPQALHLLFKFCRFPWGHGCRFRAFGFGFDWANGVPKADCGEPSTGDVSVTGGSVRASRCGSFCSFFFFVTRKITRWWEDRRTFA